VNQGRIGLAIFDRKKTRTAIAIGLTTSHIGNLARRARLHGPTQPPPTDIHKKNSRSVLVSARRSSPTSPVAIKSRSLKKQPPMSGRTHHDVGRQDDVRKRTVVAFFSRRDETQGLRLHKHHDRVRSPWSKRPGQRAERQTERQQIERERHNPERPSSAQRSVS